MTRMDQLDVRSLTTRLMKAATFLAWGIAIGGPAGCEKSVDVDVAGRPVTTPGELPVCADQPPGSPPLHGPAMTPVGFAGGACFWTDVTEVPVAHYAEFLDDSDAINHLPEICAGNTDLTTSACEQKAAGGSVVISSGPDHPVVCVDWCDAAAFCSWAGKSLCQGNWAAATTASESSFYSACSSGGVETTVEGCNTADHPTTGCTSGSCTTQPVGTAGCTTELGVHDIIGNAREWTAECESDAATAKCLARGGSIVDDNRTCQADGLTLSRSSALPDLGFRCCLHDTPQ